MANKRSRRRRSNDRQPSRASSAAPRDLSRLSISPTSTVNSAAASGGVKTLHRRRAKLLDKIATVDAQIMARAGSIASEAGLTARGTGRIRPKNDTNLIDALRAVLKGKTMGVSEAAEAVQKAGYKSSAAYSRVIVNAALLKKKHFKKVERGRYTAV